jgi:hypothetical protein
MLSPSIRRPRITHQGLNMNTNQHAREDSGCGSPTHFSRRTLLQWTGASSLLGWTSVAEALARVAEKSKADQPARSVIILWLQGGASQLDTFDPHPKSRIGGGIKGLPTTIPGVELSEWFPTLAERMEHVALIRSVVSQEGDHERATYQAKTSYRPDPTLFHPAMGAVLCHQLSDEVEIPRHISILPGAWPARGGYLGDRYDAFKIGDPATPVPDVRPRVAEARLESRISDLTLLEDHFARRRLRQLDQEKTLHFANTQAALQMMSSEQLSAFELDNEPESVRAAFGPTPFGRGCLAAIRLVEAGVRCIEVTLDGWDSHINNNAIQQRQSTILDAAFSALLDQLHERNLFDQTLVLCGGEFGRTPRMNPVEGRDHWPHGFSVALAGGGIHGGRVIGATSPEELPSAQDPLLGVSDPRDIADVHATIYSALGVPFQRELMTPVGRPMKICSGTPIRALLDA